MDELEAWTSPDPRPPAAPGAPGTGDRGGPAGEGRHQRRVRLWRRRRPALSGVQLEALGVPRGERVLAWAATEDGELVVATGRQLYRGRPGDAGAAAAPAVASLPWHQVDQVGWDDEESTLTVHEVGVAEPRAARLAGSSLLPEVVHERVRHSMVTSREFGLPGGGSVLVALRRRADGALVTQVRPGPGVDLDEAGTARVVTRLEADLRAEAGH